MATPTHQRVFIIFLAVVMLVGTIGSFAALILANENQSIDTQRTEAASKQYTEQYDDYQDKLSQQAAQLSDEYHSKFKRYEDSVKAFDADGIDELSTKDLLAGEGKVIDGDTPMALYYIGWNPDGEVFDSSLAQDALKEPIYHSDDAQGFVGLENGIDQASLIAGWKDGVKGMKIGGVREITIPSDKAYGPAGSGEQIPPNTPLKFIVMSIPAPDDIPQPEVPEILRRGQYGQ